MDYKAVLFDFDYTMGDATDAIVASFDYALTTMGYPAPPRETVRRTIGMVVAEAYTLLTGDESREGQERFYSLFHPAAHERQAGGQVKLFPGGRELLQGLKEAGVQAGVVTSKNIVTIEAILSSLGLRDLFSCVVGGNSDLPHKPDPTGTLWALEQMGVEPGEALYCGDTTIDARTAQNAGMDFAAVLNGTTPGEDFRALPSVRVCPDLWDLKSWLKV